MLSILAFLFFGALLVTLGFSQSLRRRRGLVRVGSSMGLRYVERDPSVAKELAQIPSIASATRQSFSNVLRGGNEILFDRVITRPERKRRRREFHSSVAIREAGAQIPPFQLVRADSKKREAVQGRERRIEFSDDPPFSERFHLWSDAPDAVLTYFDADRRGRFALAEDVLVEGGGEWIVRSTLRRRTPPQDLPAIRERARALAQTIVGR